MKSRLEIPKPDYAPDPIGGDSENKKNRLLTYEEVETESKKFNGLVASLIAEKMPNGKFDLKDPECLKVFSSIFNQIKNDMNKARKLKEEKDKKPFSFNEGELLKDNCFGGSKIHNRRNHLELALYNHGIFNSLLENGILQEEDRTTFFKVMPEFTEYITSRFGKAWEISNSIGISEEAKQSIYSKKILLYDKLAKKVSGSDAFENEIKKIAKWMNNVYWYVYKSKDQKDVEWEGGGEKPKTKFLDAFSKIMNEEPQYGHFGLRYFELLEEGGEIRPEIKS